MGVPRKTRTLRLDWKRGGILQVQFIGPGGIDYINPADDPASSSRLGNLRHAHTTTDTVAQRFAVRVLHTPRAIRRTVRAIAAPGNRLEQPTPVYVAIVGLVSAAPEQSSIPGCASPKAKFGSRAYGPRLLSDMFRSKFIGQQTQEAI